MTRINTNVSSLIAQKTLARSNDDLQTALTRLSTGLRINVGKDDPAGLIASEALRSDIISVEKAITNSERANQLIATADSALGQVSKLLNDVRGLVSEAANTGALSDDQVAANQLQIDSSLEAVDRIAQITSFQGRKLLDGSLNFISENVDSSAIEGLQIDQANFGTQSEIGVKVNVVAQATRGSLNYELSTLSADVVLEIGGSNGTEAFSFAAGSTIEEIATAVNLVSDATGVKADVASGATQGEFLISSLGVDNDIQLTANDAGFDAGNVQVKFTEGNTTSTAVTYSAASGSNPATIDVALRTVAAESATGKVDDNGTETKATLTIDTGGDVDNDIEFTAKTAGANGNDLKVEYIDTGDVAPLVEFSTITNTLTVSLDAGVTTANAVIEAVNTDSYVSGFIGADTVGAGTGADAVAASAAANLTGAIGDTDNDFQITAKLAGDSFNGTDVNIVSGNSTAAGIHSLNNTASGTFTAAASAFSITAKDDGVNGNEINVVFTNSTSGTGVGVTVVGNTITIDADNTANAESTAANIVTAIEASVDANKLIGISTTNGANTQEAIEGTLSLDNGHHATATVTDGTSTLTFAAKELGPSGADLSIVILDADLGAGAGGETVVVSGNTITLNIDTNTGNGGATTFADVVALIQGDAAASRLIDVDIEGVGSGTFVGNNSTNDLTTNSNLDEVQAEYVEYSADAKGARASITFDGAAGGVANNDIVIEAIKAGTDFNNVSIVLETQTSLGATTPTASYDAANKVLTLRIDDAAATTTANLATAIESVKDAGGVQLFNVIDDASVEASDGTGTIDGSALGTIVDGSEIGNTGNSGGEAGTLFVYVESGVSTAQNVINQVAGATADGVGNNNLTARAAELFDVGSAVDNDGSGKLFAITSTDALTGGVDGGGIAADANEVIAAINATTGLSDVLTASLKEGDDGKNEIVGAFEEFATSGTILDNNGLQFLGAADAANVRLVADAANQVLSISDNRSFASLTKDSDAADSALVFTAKLKGSEFDGVRVEYVDDNSVTKGNEIVSYDAESKTLKFLVATGNTPVGSDAESTVNTTAADIEAALAADDLASQFFEASSLAGTDGSGVIDADLTQASIELGFNTGADVIRISSNDYGTADNSLTIVLTNTEDAPTTASFDSATGVLTIVSDDDATTVEDLVTVINDSVGGDFTADIIASAGGTTEAANADAGNGTTFSGGLGTDSDANGVPDPTTTDNVSSGGLGDTLEIVLATDEAGVVTTTAADIVALFDDSANASLLGEYGISASSLLGSDGTGLVDATATDIEFATSGTNLVDASASGTTVAGNGIDARISLTAAQKGDAFNGVTLVLENDNSLTAGSETAAYDADSKTLTVKIDATVTTADQVIAAINTDIGDLFTAAEGTGGNGNGIVETGDTVTLSGGVIDDGAVDGAALIGNENAASTGLTFLSTNFGSDRFVSVKALNGTFALVNDDGETSVRDNGTDVNARINGIQAIGRGLRASINTSSLDLGFSINADVTDGEEFTFEITGGGALFQLGPDVVSNQQARLGVQSVGTATLGGVSGRLFEMRSGGAKSLKNDVGSAAKVVDEAITVVTQLRGRLGAFQKTTLETNIFTLNDTLANLTDAESSIRDADFAAESARLTRAQILVQSGTSVLSIANSNPQNVLSLIR